MSAVVSTVVSAIGLAGPPSQPRYRQRYQPPYQILVLAASLGNRIQAVPERTTRSHCNASLQVASSVRVQYEGGGQAVAQSQPEAPSSGTTTCISHRARLPPTPDRLVLSLFSSPQPTLQSHPASQSHPHNASPRSQPARLSVRHVPPGRDPPLGSCSFRQQPYTFAVSHG